jgi:uncharacterized protein YigE (DUF2233 family)
VKVWILLIFAACGTLCAAIREEQIEHAGTKFRVVRTAPDSLMLVWKDPAGEPFRSFDRVQQHFSKQGRKVVFLMNAGIFEPGGIPSGLHQEAGVLRHPLNLEAGKGNFFLKPNGVFGTGGRMASVAFVEEAGKFPAREISGFRSDLALQSGPLLLTGGKRHPAFKEGSENKLLRNGVGVDGKGQVVFAITARGEKVNFWDFAGLFLQLGCKDALFLDGVVSQMAVNPIAPVSSNPFGAMLVIVE